MLSDTVRTQIDDLVKKNRVMLFMKGSRSFPQCGFSATVVGILGNYVPKFETFNVLSSPEVREGIKEYSSWPTIPQLYIDGKFIGGCDIVKEMHQTGELAKLLGVEPPKREPVKVTLKVKEEARKGILEAQKEAGGDPLRLTISPRHDYDLYFEAKHDGDVVVEDGGITVVLDPESASRAGDLVISAIPDKGFVIESSKAPPRVKPLTAAALKDMLETDGKHVLLLDVRPEAERNIASIPGHKPLEPEMMESLDKLPADMKVVLYCHHGMRSRAAADHLLSRGVKNVFNLEGGINAYSAVDPKIPRY